MNEEKNISEVKKSDFILKATQTYEIKEREEYRRTIGVKALSNIDRKELLLFGRHRGNGPAQFCRFACEELWINLIDSDFGIIKIEDKKLWVLPEETSNLQLVLKKEGCDEMIWLIASDVKLNIKDFAQVYIKEKIMRGLPGRYVYSLGLKRNDSGAFCLEYQPSTD